MQEIPGDYTLYGIATEDGYTMVMSMGSIEIKLNFTK